MATLCLINFPEFSESKEFLKIGRSEVCVWGGVLKVGLLNCPYLYIYIQEVLIQESDPQLPPHSHTSDRPIFKIPFDSENSGKLTRFRIARFLIFAS